MSDIPLGINYNDYLTISQLEESFSRKVVKEPINANKEIDTVEFSDIFGCPSYKISYSFRER